MTKQIINTELENGYISIKLIDTSIEIILKSDLLCTCPKVYKTTPSNKSVRAWRYIKSIFDNDTTYLDVIKIFIGFKIVYYPDIF